MIKENKPLATFHMPDRDLYIFTESMGLDSKYLLYDADMQCLNADKPFTTWPSWHEVWVVNVKKSKNLSKLRDILDFEENQ